MTTEPQTFDQWWSECYPADVFASPISEDFRLGSRAAWHTRDAEIEALRAVADAARRLWNSRHGPTVDGRQYVCRACGEPLGRSPKTAELHLGCCPWIALQIALAAVESREERP